MVVFPFKSVIIYIRKESYPKTSKFFAISLAGQTSFADSIGPFEYRHISIIVAVIKISVHFCA